jgi:preprotein translocase subunit YajC
LVPLLASIEWLLAEDAGNVSPLTGLLVPMLIIGALFYLMIIRPQKTKERDFKNLLSNLKKNDRVVTIGGIHGVVTNVQRDADRVTIRVDDATGTTLRVGLSAIGRVVTDDEQTSDKTAAK